MLLQNDPFFNSLFGRLAGPAASAPTMDAYRRGSDVWVHLDVPGIAADSLDISVERSVLTITGERSWAPEAGDQVYVTERSQGRFRRQVHLGDGLDADGIEANYQDGVLTLRIPVSERAKPRKITVSAATPALDVEGSVTDSAVDSAVDTAVGSESA